MAWRWAVLGAAGASLLFVVLWAARIGPFAAVADTPAPHEREWVLVADFNAPDSAIGDGVRALIETALDRSTLVRTVPRTQLRPVQQAAGLPAGSRLSPETARQLAVRANVRTLVTGDIVRLADEYQVSLRWMMADSAVLLATLAERAKGEDALIDAADRLSRKLRKEIGENPTAIRATRRLPLHMTGSFAAFEHGLRGLEAFSRGELLLARREFHAAAALDSGFAMAWAGVATTHWNSFELDSARHYIERAVQPASRTSEGQRAFYEGLRARWRDDLTTALPFLEQAAAKGWVNSNNAIANVYMSLGRPAEALEYYRRHAAEQFHSFGPRRRVNEWRCLITLGRLAEAESLAMSPEAASFMPCVQAVAASRWSQAETLGRALLADESEPSLARANGAMAWAAGLAAQGRAAEARRVLARAGQLPDLTTIERCFFATADLYLALTTGGPSGPGLESRIEDARIRTGYQMLRAAVLEDPDRARELIAARRDTLRDLYERFELRMATALVGSRLGRADEVLGSLSGAVATALFEERAFDTLFLPVGCWLVADAWEEKGRLDSALVVHESTDHQPLNGVEALVARGILDPHVRARRVALNVRLGRLDRATAEFAVLRAQVSSPDPALASAIAAAWRELEQARVAEDRAEPGVAAPTTGSR